MNVKDIVEFLNANPLLKQSLAVTGILALSAAAFFITKRYLFNLLGVLVKKSKNRIDDFIFDEVVSTRVAFLPSILIIYNFAHLVPSITEIVQRGCYALVFLIILSSFIAFLKAVNKIYDTKEKYRNRPIKGYIQAVTIILNVVGVLIMVGILTGQSLWTLMSGVGALTAVLMLIFKDTILSFVASLEITAYDIVRLGDWIEAPKHDADGDVLDISLHTIKIRNFDKTITFIPTHKLLEFPFKNWRGMQESGGRRIKRAINIDTTSIKFCNAQMLEKFENIQLLADYIQQKRDELDHHNTKNKIDLNASLINGRRLTNIGTFRAYIEAYLKSHPKIDQTMTFLVRQKAPGSEGIPIEIYVFANDTVWANYEAIQADIFDHLLASINEFELAIFQNPSSNDLKQLR